MQKFEISKRLQNFQRKKASYTLFCTKKSNTKTINRSIK